MVLNVVGKEDKRVDVLVGERFTISFYLRMCVDLYFAVQAIRFELELNPIFDPF